MSEETLIVNRRALLKFMNEGEKTANGHHTAMTGFLGEPLAAALILHYLTSQGKTPQIESWKVTPGTTKGQRLDVWISDGAGTLYQTEIKMWAGNAIGGLRLTPNLTEEELSRLARKQWSDRLWSHEKSEFLTKAVSKVLKRMEPPKGVQDTTIEPLLCLWWLVQPNEEEGPWFKVDVNNPLFEHFYVFSLTAYLMSISDEHLELHMPIVSKRLDWLRLLLPGTDSSSTAGTPSC